MAAIRLAPSASLIRSTTPSLRYNKQRVSTKYGNGTVIINRHHDCNDENHPESRRNYSSHNCPVQGEKTTVEPLECDRSVVSDCNEVSRRAGQVQNPVTVRRKI